MNFEELEKSTLDKHKQDQYDKQFKKLCRTIQGGVGMAHILVQCQVDDNSVKALKELGLDDERKFVSLLDQLEEFENKVPSPIFDNLVAAATWMKENNNIPSTSCDSEFTDEVLTIQLELLHIKREEKKQERERKDDELLVHILTLCGMKKDGRDHLKECDVTSLKELLSLPESI